MNAQDFKQLLIELNACADARNWSEGKSWKEVYKECHRGDWLIWLFKKTTNADKRLRALVAGHCANTVRHLMENERSTNAVDVVIRFGNGLATEDELRNAADNAAADNAAYANAAYAAAYAAADNAAYANAAYANAAYAAANAAYANAAYAAAYAAANAAYANAAYANAAYAAYDAAKKANQKQTADIVRKFIPIEKFNI